MQEYQANWTPNPLKIVPGRFSKIHTKNHRDKKTISVWTILGFILIGIFLGYLFGLWQQAAQMNQRDTVCKAYF